MLGSQSLFSVDDTQPSLFTFMSCGSLTFVDEYTLIGCFDFSQQDNSLGLVLPRDAIHVAAGVRQPPSPSGPLRRWARKTTPLNMGGAL